MDTSRLRRVTAALAALPLALGAGLVPAPAAQAVGGVALYDCQQVIYHGILPNTPINGYPCTGPVGTSPGGTVSDRSTGTVYHCDHLDASDLGGGQIFVFGNRCVP
jgi:hypothetical protein